MEAGPAIVGEIGGPADLGSNRIEMNVVTQGAKSVDRVDDQSFVAALEDVSVFLTETIEARGESPLQPAHALGEVGAGSRECEVVVIGHDGPRVDDPADAVAGFAEAFQEGLLGALRAKDRRLIVAAINDVVDAGFGFQPESTCHVATMVGAGGEGMPPPLDFR